MAYPTVEERFWAKVNQSDDCWSFDAYHSPDGYARFWVGGRTVEAHRFVYELLVASIEAGLVIDHLCRNRWCVNPDHMEPVTNHVNILRGEPATKTHCVHGHLLDEANTYRRRGSNGKRQCRTCGLEATRRYRRKKAAA